MPGTKPSVAGLGGGIVVPVACLVLALPPSAGAQGCVAARHTSLNLADCGLNYHATGEWTGTFNFRWLYSDHHFRGDHDEGDLRYERGNEVINDTYGFDLTALYAFSPRYSAALTLPFVYNTRSSLYEHDRVNRYETSAGGIADLRLLGYAWLLEPSSHPAGNVALGLGFKAPTGDADATDRFHTSTGPAGLRKRVPIPQRFLPRQPAGNQWDPDLSGDPEPDPCQ